MHKDVRMAGWERNYSCLRKSLLLLAMVGLLRDIVIIIDYLYMIQLWTISTCQHTGLCALGYYRLQCVCTHAVMRDY